MNNTTKWFIVAGVVLGAVAAFLAYSGNPGNMGVCAACFLRDTTGALGFHRAAVVQYVRLEIIGLVLGGFVASMFWTKEFKPVANASAFPNFFLGIFAMIGALVFLGCPWRAFLRLGGGDMTAVAGFLGLGAGVAIASWLKKVRGYAPETNVEVPRAYGYLPLVFALILFAFLLIGLKVGENGPLFFSAKGPGSMHANIWLALGAGALIGVFIHKSKFCSVGAFARAFRGDWGMFMGIVAVVVAASVVNFALGQYKFGFEGQPIAHNDWIWNFLGMVLAGLCFSLSEGCPGKHLVQMGTGNLGSVIFVLGMMAGAAIAHNFLLASSAAGITAAAPYAVVLGFAVALFIGFFGKKAAIRA